MPAQAVAGDRKAVAAKLGRVGLQTLLPRFHVDDLPERPALFLDLQRVFRLVVPHRVVGKFGEEKTQDIFAILLALGFIGDAMYLKSVPLKPVLVFALCSSSVQLSEKSLACVSVNLLERSLPNIKADAVA